MGLPRGESRFPEPKKAIDNASSIVYTGKSKNQRNPVLKPGNYELLVFRDRSGRSPYQEWLASLDAKTRERVLSRMGRLKWGQFGDFKSLDGGLYELRLFFGPGYRVYFGEHRGKMILLLTGGDKSTQKKDIKMAKQYWKTYLEDNA